MNYLYIALAITLIGISISCLLYRKHKYLEGLGEKADGRLLRHMQESGFLGYINEDSSFQFERKVPNE